MSIIRIKNNEINPEAWDKLVLKCKRSRIFSRYDYLKAVSPDFEAIVEEVEGEYINAFPIVTKSKFGLNYIVQPVFTQQLQILTVADSPSEDFLNTLNNYIKDFISVRLSLDSKSAQLFRNNNSYKTLERVTYLLDLAPKNFSEGYSKNHKRNIKNANKKKWILEINNDYESLLAEFIVNKGEQINVSENFKGSFERLIPFFKSNEDIRVFSAIDEDGKRMASALFAGHLDLMTFLLSYSSDKAKKWGIMHALINEWLLNHSSEYKLLDFEGGNIESLARFYSGFGAEKNEFVYLEKHSFPIGYFFK